MVSLFRSVASCCALALLSVSINSNAQCLAKVGDGSFKKGSLLIGLTEGGTHASYITKNTKAVNDGYQNTVLDGDRDPLILEYGVTNHWGFGFTLGTDIFDVNPKMYDFITSSGKVQAFMSEFTLDANYHLLVTKKVDLSVFGSFGTSSVTFRGNEGDQDFQYNASGGLIRAGGRIRYYIGRRFGFMGMFSTFASGNSPDKKKASNVGADFATGIRGHAYEFGLCYRVFK